MISSVIVKLNCAPETSIQVISQIASHPALECGELVNDRNLPATIDAFDNRESEEVTRWILAIDGVSFVDVVFVHFEEGDQVMETRTEVRKQNA